VQVKEESLAQAQALKEELDETNSLLEQKMAEIGMLTQQLIDTKDGLDELEAQLEIHVQKDGETIQRLEQRVSDEKKLREATIEKMNSMNKEIEELQMKLTECENKSKTIGDKHVDELQQSISAYEKIRDELRASHQEVEELNTKLDYCKGKKIFISMSYVKGYYI
jgi:chromosome segregation ATPase